MHYSLFTNAKKWIIDNKTEFALLLLILIIGAFLRLFRISEYMTFLGDEGRDAIVVRRLLVDRDIILVGPGTSIGNMYLGPLYYYMMAPALLLANFSPVGPAIMIALLGVVTIFFVWFVTRKWFPSTHPVHSGQVANMGALVAAFLYAISPTVITYSRSSWNPNIMPFFALLAIYSSWKFWFEKKYKWIIISGISMAFVLQSHYLGMLLIPTVGILWLTTLVGIRYSKNGKWKMEIRKFLRITLVGIVFFAGLMSPLAIFDARHGWRNFEAMKIFFTQRQSTVSARPWTAIPTAWPNFTQYVSSMVAAHDQNIGIYLSGAIIVLMTFLIVYRRSTIRNKHIKATILILLWLGFSVIGFGVYKQHVYDHYYGFIFPAVFILIGGVFGLLYKSAKNGGKVILLVGIFSLVWINIVKNPLRYSPNGQLQRSQAVSRKIMEEIGNNKFNIAVIAEQNYEGAYQYYLERWNAPVVMIDPQRASDTITDQLFVVCEYEDSKKCDPTHNPKTEIANFGWTKIENEWSVAGVTLFKLVHY